MPNINLRFDMRNPQSFPGQGAGTNKAELYKAAIEMAEWADTRGFDTVQISEHHGSDDGYIPSPIVLASAIAARTKRIKLRFAVVLLPLHDPIRLAEDLAVLDIVSNGRVTVAFGAGYAAHEFEMFGVSQRDHDNRYKYAQEWIEVVKRCWGPDEDWDFEGEFLQLKGIRSKPKPIGGSRPVIMNAGASGDGKAVEVSGEDQVKELRQLLNESKLGNHPALIRMFAFYGSRIGEDNDFIRADGGAQVKQPREAVRYPHDANNEGKS